MKRKGREGKKNGWKSEVRRGDRELEARRKRWKREGQKKKSKKKGRRQEGWNLCIIAADRYTATVHPAWYRDRRRRARDGDGLGLPTNSVGLDQAFV